MMQAEYNRSQGVNYMILEGQQGLLDYEEKMLSENTIPVLLNFHIVRTNAKLQYWYDITGRKSVRTYAEREGLSVENVQKIMEAVAAAYRMLAQYLIREEKICIDPDTVFLKNTGTGLEAALCFYPKNEADGQNSMLSITEFFLGVVDHEKTDAAELCYALYEEAVRRDASPESLLQVLENKSDQALFAQGQQETIEPENEPVPQEPKEKEERTRRKFWKRQEKEDFWDTKENDTVTMDDVFSEEEEEDASLAERITAFFSGIPGRLFGGFRKKKEEIFPPKDLEEDLIYDPTVLLSADKDTCFGKLIYEGTEDETDHMIVTDEFHIGSAKKGNQAVLHSPVVSHHHAKITKKDDTFYIEDLNSTNGTYLNGEAITLGHKYELKYMDRIHFANVPYRIV